MKTIINKDSKYFVTDLVDDTVYGGPFDTFNEAFYFYNEQNIHVFITPKFSDKTMCYLTNYDGAKMLIKLSLIEQNHSDTMIRTVMENFDMHLKRGIEIVPAVGPNGKEITARYID